MITRSRVLLVEDCIALATVYQAYLAERPYDVMHVANVADARAYLVDITPDIVLLDLELPEGNGLEILKQMKEQERDSEIIIMTADGSSEPAINAMSMGAFDFLTKPFDATRLLVTMENASTHHSMHRRLQTLSEMLPTALDQKLMKDTDAANQGPARNNGLVPDSSTIEPLWIIEKRAIENAITAFDRHVNKAAAALGVAPSTLYRKIQSWKGAKQSA